MAHLTVISQLAVTQLAFVDGVSFHPFFRGLLSVLAAVAVLIGSVYLIIATDVGTRQGMLVALSGLFGWMFLMGIVWTVYGIGWKGDAPTWHLVEVNTEDGPSALVFSEVPEVAELVSQGGVPAAGLGSLPVDSDEVLSRIDDETARTLATEALAGASTVGAVTDPDVAQDAALLASRTLALDDWRYLPTSDATRGEAQASVDAFLIETGRFEAGEYVPEQFGAFIWDGKPVLEENPNLVERVVHTLDETIVHPWFRDEFLVMQVRGAVRQPTLPGQPPPVATADAEQPLVSVVMERDRGGPFPALFSGLRFTPAMFTVFCGLIFALLAWNLHVRDQRIDQIRAAAG